MIGGQEERSRWCRGQCTVHHPHTLGWCIIKLWINIRVECSFRVCWWG